MPVSAQHAGVSDVNVQITRLKGKCTCKPGKSAVAGTGRGSDTALVMQAASSQHVQKLRVHEVLCKPLNPLSIEEVRAKMA